MLKRKLVKLGRSANGVGWVGVESKKTVGGRKSVKNLPESLKRMLAVNGCSGSDLLGMKSKLRK